RWRRSRIQAHGRDRGSAGRRFPRARTVRQRDAGRESGGRGYAGAWIVALVSRDAGQAAFLRCGLGQAAQGMIPDTRRIEELSLNSSAPPGQLLYDGWVVRLLRGKAKRARSVNAVYESTVPLAEKIPYCERLYEAAALPAIFRITPFSMPSDLDRVL